ncbi:hypothetical protein NP493_139g02053 [Ridgeia piscesae]|uniref:Uncharacterized protein n=1 Tax=Ridgeia piscesae TaxID=27915 RepID=A0AAD9P4Y0_RIDPI|nr:hypothetical protein NP493_139g02053 [Ridgeia piscesae]
MFIISHARGSGEYFNTIFYVRWQLDALTLAVARVRVLSWDACVRAYACAATALCVPNMLTYKIMYLYYAFILKGRRQVGVGCQCWQHFRADLSCNYSVHLRKG